MDRYECKADGYPARVVGFCDESPEYAAEIYRESEDIPASQPVRVRLLNLETCQAGTWVEVQGVKEVGFLRAKVKMLEAEVKHGC